MNISFDNHYFSFAIRVIVAIIITISSIPLSRFVSNNIKSTTINARNNNNTHERNLIYLDLGLSMLRYFILFIAVVISLKIIYVDTTVIFGALGVLGLGLSLAFQDYMKDFVSGLFLIFFDYFRSGDLISLTLSNGKNILGRIHEFRFFSTTIEERQNVLSEIPNSQLWSSNLTNVSRLEKFELSFIINISNKNNLKDVTNVIKNTLINHKLSQEKNYNNIVIFFKDDQYKGTTLECRVPVLSNYYMQALETIPRDVRYELQKHSFIFNDLSIHNSKKSTGDIQYRNAFTTPIIIEDTHYE
tara:strand:+ start:1684 stop:2586 length:903 start_codon:yes stop_codon:yes gene_type:complete